MDRERQAGTAGGVLLAHSLHFQDASGRRPRRRRRARCRRRGTLDGASRSVAGATAADLARQRRRELAADEREVRRDHDARLPAVHQGHVPGRHPHGHLLGTVRGCHRRHDVRGASVRSLDRVRKKVARQDGGEDGGDRHQGPAHLEQRAHQPGLGRRRRCARPVSRSARSGSTRERFSGRSRYG